MPIAHIFKYGEKGPHNPIICPVGTIEKRGYIVYDVFIIK